MNKAATAVAYLLALIVWYSILPRPLLADNWPQFRGASASGVADSDCPLQWDANTNIRWRVPLEGEGWSCPVVWGNDVIVTAAVPLGGDADTSPEPYQGGGGRRRDDLTSRNYRWEVVCLDAQTGDVNWRTEIRTGRPTIPRHNTNTYATETPVTDGEHIYAYFGMHRLCCLKMNGDLVWRKDLGSYDVRAGWGTASSPVLLDDKLYLQIDNEEQSFLIAIDTKTGNQIWRVDRPEATQYSTPIVWRNSVRNELIVGGMVYRSYDPATGELLWTLDMAKGRSSATPLAIGDRLYVGTELRSRGGPDDGGGYLFAVKPGGAGDITPPDDAAHGEFVEWKVPRSGIQMASPVECEGYIYLLERRGGIVNCISKETGSVVYRRRLPRSSAFWASPWTCGGRVYCLDDSGTTYVLAAGPTLDVLATNALDEQAWSTPAVVDGAIFLRTVDHLYCIAQE